MKVIRKYEADDGTIFESEMLCKLHDMGIDETTIEKFLQGLYVIQDICKIHSKNHCVKCPLFLNNECILEINPPYWDIENMMKGDNK